MTIIHDWSLSLDIDSVLRGQGADPDVIRRRNPQLVAVARRALEEGQPYIQPVVAYRNLLVEGVRHEQLLLKDGGVLSGKTVIRLLAPARRVIVALCTIGGSLEDLATLTHASDPLLGLALDGLGTAAVEELAREACRFFGELAVKEGWRRTNPLEPGMEGWPASEGQPQLFTLVNAEEAGIRLTSSGMMIPRKSVSMAIGLGEAVDDTAGTCDYCQLRETCHYRGQYSQRG